MRKISDDLETAVPAYPGRIGLRALPHIEINTETMTVKTSIMLRSVFGLTAILSLYAFCLFMVASLAVFAMLFAASRQQVEPARQPNSFFDIPFNQMQTSEDYLRAGSGPGFRKLSRRA